MLTKLSKNLIQRSQKSFATLNLKSSLFNMIGIQNPTCSKLKTATADPRVALDVKATTVKDSARPFTVTKLSNGITVMTEKESIPSVVDLGILLDVGTRDENVECSGAMLSIKNTYLKTVLNTNETVNYGMVQMSGGKFEMDYDQESSYFKANCLSHDVVDIFNMMCDSAVEPKSVVAASVGVEKNKGSHKLEDLVKSGEEFNNLVFKTAYGLKGIGLPLKGLKSNVKNLTAYNLQKFQMENINPSRIICAAAGVQNHQEFVDLVTHKLGLMPKANNAPVREKTQYLGGESRTLTEDNILHLLIAFESAPWKSSDFLTVKLLEHVLRRSVLSKNAAFVDVANAFNFTFSDSGLFGVQLTGAADKGKEMLELVANELKSTAKKITPEELEKAKKNLVTQMLMAMERQSDRLEEAAKNLKAFGKVIVNEYPAEIEKITADNLQKALGGMLSKGKVTFVAQGGEANKLPSLDKLENMLKA